MKHVLPVGLLLVALFTACEGTPKKTPLPPPVAPKAYRSDAPGNLPIRRVAVLPLAAESSSPEALRDVERAFASELGKEGYFEVVSVSRSELENITGERQLLSVRPLPNDLLTRLRERFGVDGVLFIDLTHYSPYRPVSMGVRAKLVDVSTARIHWALDHVYDAGNPSVAEAAKSFQKAESNDQRALPDDGGSVLLSPARFARYVAAETFSTLRSGGRNFADSSTLR